MSGTQTKMRLILAIAFLFGSGVHSADTDCKRDTIVVCYWGTWSVYREDIGHFTTNDIDPSLCTTIVYSFAGLGLNFEITNLDSWTDIDLGGFSNLTSLKEDYPCLKTTLAVGGWNEGSIKYSVMAYTEEGRKTFADSVLKFITYYGFDGIDLDWEYPTTRGGIPEDMQNFASLVETIKQTISPWNLTLTIAVPIDTSLIGSAYDIPSVKDTVDHVHLMTYDYSLPSTALVTGLSAPLSAIKETVSAWLEAGIPPEKLILGIPAYARTYTLVDDDHHDVGDPVTGAAEAGEYTQEAGFLAYYELQQILQDEFQKMTAVQTDDTNYAYGNEEWFTYETETTVRTKTQYALDNGLGGVMLWSIDNDDFQGLYGDKYTLLSTINKVVNENKSRRK
ncbi:hypothetical protein NQ318_017159 [Aromia moschata]|uniref:GH18 domain-containing protein n=1 Tax=Aromia moschata TaxID=1265417 RepID=A0AAV8YR84_9CUCU|nr:hypothetical protein NQ318_017159 [Aromia moschata]